jgi:endoglucanase
MEEEQQRQDFLHSRLGRLLLIGLAVLLLAALVSLIPMATSQHPNLAPIAAIAKATPVASESQTPSSSLTGTAQPSSTPTAQSGASPTATSSHPPTATPTLAPTPKPPNPPPQFSGVHVQGNELLNSQNQQVILRGVNRSGTEYACIQGWGIFDGPSNAASVQAIASWKVNAVRIPLNEDCWLAINGAPAAYSGTAYQQAIVNFVTLLNQHGIYAILELHWSAPGSLPAINQAPMPDRDHSVTFWKGVAATFKGDTGVLFDLFNEPFPSSNGDTTNGWQCWENGSTSDPSSCSGTTYYDNNGHGTTYQVAGMQELVTAVRSVGAPNVILLGGLQYSNTLSHWLTYKPSDPLNNLAASWHVYPVGNICNSTACYNSQVAPVAASVPLIATEVGESVDGNTCSVTNTNVVLNWLDAHNSGYLAWTWDTWGTSCGDLSLILDYSGTPKSPNGTNFKSHLASVTG